MQIFCLVRRPVLALFCLLGLMAHPAKAATPPPGLAAGASLAEALNPDGTLRPGASGSFDARQFRMDTAPNGRPVFRPAGTQETGDERWQDGFGLANGTDGAVRAIVQVGGFTYVGGRFSVAGTAVANGVARWDGTRWQSLGTGLANGVNGEVSSLAASSSGEVYVVGSFTQAGGQPAANIAKWNGTAWSSLGTGLNSLTTAVAVTANGTVYAGGWFSQAGGAAANRVARWDGTAWYPLGTGAANGVNDVVSALVLTPNGELYAGGSFTLAGGAAANYVARWTGTAWRPLATGTANGLNGQVEALAATPAGDVYVGGHFTQAGGTPVSYVARWAGNTWSALGAGVDGFVRTLAVAPGGEVLAGGTFLSTSGLTANGIARWNGTAWSNLGTGTTNGLSQLTGGVEAVAVTNSGEVYIGGFFAVADGIAASRLARWTGTAWTGVGNGTANGMDWSVDALALAPNGTTVYAGGFFSQAGNGIANKVAQWSGSAWQSLGTGTANGTSAQIYAMAVLPNGSVYVSGFFRQVGGMAIEDIARWDGVAWQAVAGISGRINSLAVAPNGDLYAGGDISVGGLGCSVARWNGTSWSRTADRVLFNEYITALAVAPNGTLYAAGIFATLQGTAANNIARWDGATWSALGTGTNGYVGSVGIGPNGDVYAGGNFGQAGGIPARNVARWNGTAWNTLGAGAGDANSYVDALAVAPTGDVYAGGRFTQAGGLAAGGIAKWDGTAWAALGTGLNGSVRALVFQTNGKLCVGGSFTGTGDGSKALAYFAIYDPNAPLATSAPAAATRFTLYPNPAHHTATLRLPTDAPCRPLVLRDAQGRVVRRYSAPANAEAVLDVRGLPAGQYFVECGSLTQRLVVE